ncbi:MAG: EAL domain-containing protein [Cloacibacillus sp.]
MRALIKKFAFLSTALCALFLIWHGAAEARDGSVVRVGWYAQPGYMETSASGERSGYNYDYLQNIARFTGWKYQFVDGSLTELYEALQRDEIDLLGCMFMTNRRSKEALFPSLPAGEGHVSLFTAATSPIAENDYSAYDGMTVGYTSDLNLNRFKDFAVENKFTFIPKSYDTVDRMMEDIGAGKIDAGITGGIRTGKDFRVLSKFAPQPFYFAVSPKKKELFKELGAALTEIKIQRPFFSKELMDKHLPTNSTFVTFTNNEKEYIRLSKPFKVLCHDNWEPYEYFDENGQFSGIVADIFERISETTGLRFEYYTHSTLSVKEADIITSFNHDYAEAQQNGLYLTDIYMRVPWVVVRKSGVPYLEAEQLTTAVVDRFSTYKELSTKNFKFKNFTTAWECADSVCDNVTDQALLTSFSAEMLLKKAKYKDLSAVALQGYSLNAAIAIRKSAPHDLFSILNKTVNAISSQEIDNIVIRQIVEKNKVDIRAVIDEMPPDIMLLCIVILATLTVALGFAFVTKNGSMKKIQGLLYNDALTGRLSQAGFERALTARLEDGANDSLWLIDFDISTFQLYNEIFGKESGDELLKFIADKFAAAFPNDLFSRIYADHFVALVRSDDAESLSDRLIQMTEELKSQLDERSVTINYGLYKIEERSLSPQTMMNCAAAAKRMVKGQTENYIAVFDGDIHRRLMEDAALIASFDAAVTAGEIVAYIQPKYDSVSEKIIGGEALARWIPEGSAAIPPDRFVTLLEKSGQIIRLDFCILEQVCEMLRRRIKAGCAVVPIAVNFSRMHLYDHDFTAKLEAVTAKYGLPNGLIEVECTENILTDGTAMIIPVFMRLKKAGFSIAMDDFGSGYSSLSTFLKIPFDVIKLDRGFLLQRDTDRARADEVIKTIITLAHGLDFLVVAEGVETDDQLSFLRSVGCDVIQGFYFARPMKIDDFENKI